MFHHTEVVSCSQERKFLGSLLASEFSRTENASSQRRSAARTRRLVHRGPTLVFETLVFDMHRVINKDGIEVRTKAERKPPPQPKPAPWKNAQEHDRWAKNELARQQRRVVDLSVFWKSELVARLPVGTIVRLVGETKTSPFEGTVFCRVEAGDVAGWAVHSGTEAVSDADNEAGWRYARYSNFAKVSEEDAAADAPTKLPISTAELS